MLRVTQAIIPPGRFISRCIAFDDMVKAVMTYTENSKYYSLFHTLSTMVGSFFSTGEVGNVPDMRDSASNWSIRLDHNFCMSKLQEQVPSMCLKFLVVQYWQSQDRSVICDECPDN